MYKSTESEYLQLSFFQFNASCGMQLDSKNEWIKNASRLPWKVWESSYASLFPGIKGCVAKPCRMVLGSLIIQQRMGFSDRDLVKQIQENPYYQYFIGLESFQHTPPFAPTLLVEWRKRIDVSFVIKANDGALPGSSIFHSTLTMKVLCSFRRWKLTNITMVAIPNVFW